MISCDHKRKNLNTDFCQVCRKIWRYNNEPGYKEKLRKQTKEWYEGNKIQKNKSGNRVKKFRYETYGTTEEEINKLKEVQEYKCGICKQDLDKLSQKYHIDHDHRTGKIRGLLCFKCNIALGHFNDSLDLLYLAVEYMENPPINKIGDI